MELEHRWTLSLVEDSPPHSRSETTSASDSDSQLEEGDSGNEGLSSEARDDLRKYLDAVRGCLMRNSACTTMHARWGPPPANDWCGRRAHRRRIGLMVFHARASAAILGAGLLYAAAAAAASGGGTRAARGSDPTAGR